MRSRGVWKGGRLSRSGVLGRILLLVVVERRGVVRVPRTEELSSGISSKGKRLIRNPDQQQKPGR